MDEEEFAFLLVTYPNLKSIISQKRKKTSQMAGGEQNQSPNSNKKSLIASLDVFEVFPTVLCSRRGR